MGGTTSYLARRLGWSVVLVVVFLYAVTAPFYIPLVAYLLIWILIVLVLIFVRLGRIGRRA